MDIGEALNVHKLHASLAEKRDKKSRAKMQERLKFRPHSLELKQIEQIYDNYKTMSNLGFLD